MQVLQAERRTKQLQQLFPEATLAMAPTVAWKQNGAINRIAADDDFTIDATPAKSGPVWFIISNDATPRTVTFGTNFLTTGTLVGTANKTAVIAFLSDGFTLYELSRTTGL